MLFQGKSLTCTLLDDGIAELQFNLQDESVNKFNRQTLSELRCSIEVRRKYIFDAV